MRSIFTGSGGGVPSCNTTFPLRKIGRAGSIVDCVLVLSGLLFVVGAGVVVVGRVGVVGPVGVFWARIGTAKSVKRRAFEAGFIVTSPVRTARIMS
jgi:hypothetical protein